MLLMLCVIYYFINDSSIISLLLCLLFNTFLFDVYILGYNSKDMISLYNGDKEIKIEVKDESYSYEAIMGEDTLTLYFSHPGYIEIPVGSWCDFYGKRYSNTVLQDQADFVKVAEALGVKGIRVSKKEEMGPAIREAIEGGKPALIDVWIDCDEKVFPMVPAGAPIEDVFDAEDLAKKEQEKD